MHLDHDHCYRAVRSRDPRFDGWFVTAVHTTGIYCRPSCPARTPGPGNVSFYASSAAAQAAGYRACKRCRPDASPGSPEWNQRGDVVGRAMRLIADGVVDREGVTGLADRLGYSTRQIERLMTSEVGAGPLALARAQRAQTARTLIETTSLPFTDVAFGAGFSSVRQFNDTIRSVFATSPTELRRQSRSDRGATASRAGTVTLRLAFRRPFDPVGVVGHLAASAVEGCEELMGNTFRRTLRLPGGPGVAALTPHLDHVSLRLHLHDLSDLAAAVARCRRLLDLDADPEAIDTALSRDPLLAPLVRAAPGQRLPRTVDEAEMTLRVVIGQQVSLAAARTHAHRLTVDRGEPVDDPEGGLTHLFPTPAALATIDPARLAMPTRRRATLVELARALAEGTIELGPGTDWHRARAQLAAISGIGPWTTELVALRALGDPDAFAPTDLGVRRGAAAAGLPPQPHSLARHAQAWRPWRSYALATLWRHQP